MLMPASIIIPTRIQLADRVGLAVEEDLVIAAPKVVEEAAIEDPRIMVVVIVTCHPVSSLTKI